MIQQKKVNTIFSLNYFDPYKSSQAGKKSHKYKQTDQQERRKCSKSQLSNANIMNQTVNNQNRQGLNDKQKSLNQPTLPQKSDGRQRANIQNDKMKRKTSKNYNLNLSSLAVILSHTKQKQNKINSRDKRKSLLRLQVSYLNQQQGKILHDVEQKTLKSQKQQKFIPQGRKPREQATKPSFYSLKKDKRSDRLQQYQRKKHLSVVSMLQGNAKSHSKSRSKSKSKSKSKDKKGKKKNSYKFNKISFVNKENQFRKANFPVKSIQKEFKSITKKLQKQFEIKPKKSTKSTQKIDKDNIQTVDRKKSKVLNKENCEPSKKHSKTNIIRLEQAIEPNIVIKKQPLHAHRKHSQKFQLNIKPSQKRRSKQKLQNNDIYFFIKKNETPSSSRKQFPINKYIQISKPIDTQQSKRNSFQKSVKPARKRTSLNEKQISSHRSSSKDHYISLIDQTKIQSSNKTKVKKALKHKKQGNVSCLYLMAQNIEKDGLKKRSQSLSDQDIIYKESGQQFRERIHFDSKTPKQNKLQKQDIQQTIMRRKKATYSNQQQETFSQIKKISRTLKQNEQGPNEETILVYESQTFNQSLNMNQIRYYEGITPSNQQQRNIKSSSNTIIITGHETYHPPQEPKIFQRHFRSRQLIVSELKEEYPLLNKKELQFLASVCFIQRKWKQITLARKINSLISLKNTSELFVKNKTASFRPNLYTEEKSSSNFMTSVVISKSQMKNLTTQSQNTQTEQFLSLQAQQHIHDVFFKKQNQLFYDRSIQKPQTEQQKIQQKQPIIQVYNQEEQQRQVQGSRNIPFQQEDIFPDLSYLKTKKYLEKRKLFESISQLNDSFKHHQLSNEEYESRKRDLESAYKEEVRQIHDAKKALKKGYLMYIETLNTVNKSLIKEQKSMKSSRKNSSNKLLKRVNSQESVLGDIYRKIFKLDQLNSDNGSEQSGETKRLNEMFLIRKIALSNQNPKQFRKFNNLGRNMGINQQENLIYTQRGESNLKTEEDEGNVMPLSTRQIKSMQLGESTQVNLELDTNIIFQEQIFVSVTQKQNEVNKVEESEQISADIQENLQSHQQTYQLIKSQEFKSYNISQLLLSPEELNSLGESPIRNLDKKQQQSPQQLLSQPSSQHENHKHNISVREQKQFRTEQQIKKGMQPQSGDDQIENICFSLEHNHEEYNDNMPAYVSPVSSTMSISNGANAESREYLARFVQFLKQSDHWTQTITYALNSPQGFTAYAYLRFVREFELPEGQYTQIIPNQAFIEWEELNLSKAEQPKTIKSSQSLIFQDDPWHSFSITQYKSIEHRCLYELLNSELQSFRVYGEKGRPFPWQVNYSCYDPAIIEREKVAQILDKCLEKCIYNVLSFACGIVLENHPDILNEEDLEELHDKNEDQIIDMIESQLVHQKHAWYELQEHTLETNFEVSELIWNDLIHQYSKEMLKLKNLKEFMS